MENEWDDLTSDAVARKFLEHVEECARDALHPINDRVLTNKDRQTLEAGLEKLRPAFEELAAVIRETAKPGIGPVGWGALSAVMGWAFALGCKSDVQDSAEPYLQSRRAKVPRCIRPNPINEHIFKLLVKRGRSTPASEIETELIKQGVKKDDPSSDLSRKKAAWAKRVTGVRKRIS
jgi:hypothetical protein